MAESLFCLQWAVALQAVILHEKRWDINIYDPLIMVMIKSTYMDLVNVLVRFNHLPSQEKKISAFENTFFFSFHLRCCKNENPWWFSPCPVTTTIIWPTTDQIPHSVIFKRMLIKRIADNIRAFSFLLTNWNKEPDEERIYRWTEFFHKMDNKKWKMRTGARATKQIYISIYISLYMKTFLKTGVSITTRAL